MNKLKKAGSVAAVLLCTAILVMNTGFARDMINKVSDKSNIKENTVYEGEDKQDIAYGNVSGDIKGKVFDKDGNVIEHIDSENMEHLYNSEGLHISVHDNGVILTDTMIKDRIDENTRENAGYILSITDLNELQKHLDFKIKFPEYIPEGFKFIDAKCDDYEKTGSDIISGYYVEFKNSQTAEFIYFHVNHLEESQKAEELLNNINNAKEIKINGKSARINSELIVWIEDEIMYQLSGDRLNEEGIKIAESVK